MKKLLLLCPRHRRGRLCLLLNQNDSANDDCFVVRACAFFHFLLLFVGSVATTMPRGLLASADVIVNNTFHIDSGGATILAVVALLSAGYAVSTMSRTAILVTIVVVGILGALIAMGWKNKAQLQHSIHTTIQRTIHRNDSLSLDDCVL
jgi:hypothetical protein